MVVYTKKKECVQMSIFRLKHKFGVVAMALSALSGASVADDVPWPSDFWTVFSNRVTTARTAYTATTEPTSIAMSPAWTTATENGLGTVAKPFDSVDRSSLAVDVSLFNSKVPKGAFLVFR